MEITIGLPPCQIVKQARIEDDFASEMGIKWGYNKQGEITTLCLGLWGSDTGTFHLRHRIGIKNSDIDLDKVLPLITKMGEEYRARKRRLDENRAARKREEEEDRCFRGEVGCFSPHAIWKRCNSGGQYTLTLHDMSLDEVRSLASLAKEITSKLAKRDA